MNDLQQLVRHELQQLLEHEPELIRHLIQHDQTIAVATEQLSTGALGASLAGGESAGGLTSAGAESAGGLATPGAADAMGSGGDLGSDAGTTSSDTGGDTMTATNLYIDATGKTYGVFSGGVVLAEAPTGTPITSDSVQWTSDGTPTGSLEEFIQGFISGGIHQLGLYSNDQAATNVAGLVLQSEKTGGAPTSLILMQVYPYTGAGETVQLWGGDNKSIFPQLPNNAPLKTQLLFGQIGSGGGISGTSSGGFSITKGSTGLYTIKFNNAMVDGGYGVVLTAKGGYCEIVAGSQTTTQVQVETLTTADALSDLGFHFIIAGVAA